MSVHDESGHTLPLPVYGSPGLPEPVAGRGAALESVPGPESGAGQEGGSTLPLGRHHAPRRWPTVLAWALVTVCLLSLGVLGYAYKQSLDSSRAWRALADSTTVELDAARADLDRTTETLTKTKTALDETRAALDETKNNLDAVAGQYNEASARIRQLASEKAAAGDEAGLLSTAVVQAAKLQEQLDACVTGLRNLQAHLADPTASDPAALAPIVADVNSGCDQAQAQSKAFQEWLQGR